MSYLFDASTQNEGLDEQKRRVLLEGCSIIVNNTQKYCMCLQKK